MSTTVSKAGKHFSLLSVSHLDPDFSILESDFWSEADKEQIFMVKTDMLFMETAVKLYSWQTIMKAGTVVHFRKSRRWLKAFI